MNESTVKPVGTTLTMNHNNYEREHLAEEFFGRFEKRTIFRVEASRETVSITFIDGSICRFYHDQDCCEYVRLIRIVGDISSIIGRTWASLSLSNDTPDGESDRDFQPFPDSHTWSTFTIKTTTGETIDLQWLGESNGFYSEDVYVAEERTA